MRNGSCWDIPGMFRHFYVDSLRQMLEIPDISDTHAKNIGQLSADYTVPCNPHNVRAYSYSKWEIHTALAFRLEYNFLILIAAAQAYKTRHSKKN